jgi:hypothetical protein
VQRIALHPCGGGLGKCRGKAAHAVHDAARRVAAAPRHPTPHGAQRRSQALPRWLSAAPCCPIRVRRMGGGLGSEIRATSTISRPPTASSVA